MKKQAILILYLIFLTMLGDAQQPTSVGKVDTARILKSNSEYRKLAQEYQAELAALQARFSSEEQKTAGENSSKEALAEAKATFDKRWQDKTENFISIYHQELEATATGIAASTGLDLVIIDSENFPTVEWGGKDITDEFLSKGQVGDWSSDTEVKTQVLCLDKERLYQSKFFAEAGPEYDEWPEERGRNPKREILLERARAAVSVIVQQEKASVVLDRKIVLYGARECTDQVIALLESEAAIDYRDDYERNESRIGYFERTIIEYLKVFRELETEITQEREKLIQQGLSETEAIERSEEKRRSLMEPLQAVLNDSVASVAEQNGLVLILKTDFVMQGGRNLTELVVDEFLKRLYSPEDTTR